MLNQRILCADGLRADLCTLYFSSPIKCQCCPHIETSQLICTANQLTGFYMRATLAFNGLNSNCFII